MIGFTNTTKQLNEQTDYSSIDFTVYSLSVYLIAKYTQGKRQNKNGT